MIIVGVGSAIAQQICGIDAIQYYLVEILEDAGVENTNERAGWLILFSILKFAFIIVAAHLFDIKGRRPLFFISLSGKTNVVPSFCIKPMRLTKFINRYDIFAFGVIVELLW